jgi:hypothetical protein
MEKTLALGYPISMKKIPVLTSLEQFLFEVPPYAVYQLPTEEDLTILRALYGKSRGYLRVDGYCPKCHRASTFTVRGQQIPSGTPWDNIEQRVAFDDMSIVCVRDDSHVIVYYFLINKMTIEKVGQYPSLATISNDAVSPYRKDMQDEDSREFHKAIGLAAHGVGVGSFVYLRRVFERLIYRRFEEFKAQEGWDDSAFYGVRMEDKIAILKDHLPEFLVQNRKVYSILSIGVHELDEETCLSYFEAMKQSIIIILEDDKKKTEELARRSMFSAVIANFAKPEPSDG